jgi:hypothetical protein
VTENKAHALVIAAGLLGLGLSNLVLSSLGAGDHVLLVVTMFWLIAPAFCVGAVGVHYESREREHR